MKRRNLKAIVPLILFPVVLLVSCSGEMPPEGNHADASASPPAATLVSTRTGTPTAAPAIVPTETEPRPTETASPLQFDGQNAYRYLLEQMEFGPRWPGSVGHQAVRDYIAAQLRELEWRVEEQTFVYQDVNGRNIIGARNEGRGPLIILGAHYDTRKIADRTPGSDQPVPGAVDGASGVAVLLELARTLDLDRIERELWLTFFDLEDNGGGGMPGFDWIAGSTYMASVLEQTPEAVVVVDMIGDADQEIFYDGYSNAVLRSELWSIAAELGYGEYFIPEVRYHIIDDHFPFVTQGIPAVDIIDFDYPYWHTIEDTADKASPDSLHRVGRILEEWLENRLEG